MYSPKPIHLITILFMMILVGCGSFTTVQDGPPTQKIDIAKIRNAVPKALPHSRYGNPSSYVVYGKRYYVKKSAKGFVERGMASWYGMKFHGRRTSSGEPYNLYGMTAAMRTLPIPTFVKVTNLQNNRQVIVKVNDRGPFNDRRIIDLSYAAAAKLGVLKNGTAFVEVRSIDSNARSNARAHSNTKTDSDTDPYAYADNYTGYYADSSSDSAFGSSSTSHANSYSGSHRNPDLHSKPQVQHVQHTRQPQLYLQIGAFSDKASADELLQRVRGSTDQPTRIKITTGQGFPLYRVQVGPIDNVDGSDETIYQLEQAGFKEPMTVIE